MTRRKGAAGFPEVTLSEQFGFRLMHFGSPWVQGGMRIDRPLELTLEYSQRMMGWLLFVPLGSVPRRHVMQIGLGAAALAKHCHQVLKTRTTVIEINPRVVAACRQWFKLPPEDARLKIVLADGGEEIRRPRWRASVDVLQVDAYDHEAAAPVLDSADFYADCRALLTDDGCMVVNLFGRQASYAQSLARICAVFGEAAVWAFTPTTEGNTIVLAQRHARPVSRTEMMLQAAQIQKQYRLPAAKWPMLIAPVTQTAPA